MDCSQFKFAAIFLVFLFGVTTTTGGKPYCTPSSEGTLKECNWCYCVEDGVPLCTKMDCTKVPKEMWGKLDLVMRQKHRRLFITKALDAATQSLASVAKMLGSEIVNKISSLFGGKPAAPPFPLG